MRPLLYFVFIFLWNVKGQTSGFPLNAQNIIDTGVIAGMSDGINIYDDYNPVLKGDSIRYCGDYVCDGWIEDYYNNGKLAHRGLYVMGQLQTYYNFYPSGVKEREFIHTPDNKKVFTSYYPDGKLRKKIIFNKKNLVIDFETYYQNGGPQILEYYDEDGKQLKQKKEFYPSKVLAKSIILISSKKNLYEYREYNEKGQLMLFGSISISEDKITREGEWIYFLPSGAIYKKEQYKRGELIKTIDLSR